MRGSTNCPRPTRVAQDHGPRLIGSAPVAESQGPVRRTHLKRAKNKMLSVRRDQPGLIRRTHREYAFVWIYAGRVILVRVNECDPAVRPRFIGITLNAVGTFTYGDLGKKLL